VASRGFKGNGAWKIRKVIDIPAEAADPEMLPPLLKGFKAVPPLVTDINLSLDDRFLYVSCWGSGELRQYDVSDPFNPVLTGSVALGGHSAASSPSEPARSEAEWRPANGRDQPRWKRCVRDELTLPQRDEQFYPDGIRGC
jgi:selenium-binding protein 1